jgi:VWFA-related protein
MRLSRQNLLLAALCRAQEPTFSTDVKLVSLLATVRDRDGRVVKDLKKEDFLVEEDGRPQTIRYFFRESDLPLTIGLLVDTSRSQIRVLEPERKASYQFLDQVLREDRDLAFVMHFDIRVDLLQGFTSSREKLAAALAELRIPKRASTLLFAAVREASEGLMKPQTGRKAYILLSDGVDVRSKTSIGTAIEYAQRADTIIYSILYADHLRVAGPAELAAQAIYHARGRRVMRRLAQETGGGFFEVSQQEPIEKVYAQIEDELRNQYSIGYVPDPSDAGAGYRKIRLTTRQNQLVVRTRDGYYAK